MALLAAQAVSTVPVTPAELATSEAILAEVRAMDEELAAISRNQAALNKSLPARRDEVVSLRTRFPGIAVPDSPVNTTIIFNALRDQRMARAAVAKPILVRMIAESKAKACTSAAEVDKLWREYQATDDYKRSTLEERLAFRKKMEGFAIESRPMCS
jgi:hypothetical protein